MSEGPTPEALQLARREIAHDVRNGLGAIRSAAELLVRRYKPEGREKKLFEVMLKEIERLSELVARKPTPGVPPSPPPLDPTAGS